MKTEVHTVSNLPSGTPHLLDVILDHMGANLGAVETIGWTKQADGQLVDLTIYFLPAVRSMKPSE